MAKGKLGKPGEDGYNTEFNQEECADYHGSGFRLDDSQFPGAGMAGELAEYQKHTKDGSYGGNQKKGKK